MAGPRSLQTPRIEQATLGTANTGLDGSGTVVALFTGVATPGSVVRRITIKAKQVTTPGMIRLFKRHATGPVYTLIGEIKVGASPTPGATIPAWGYSGPLPAGDLLLPTANDSLYGATETGDDFAVTTEGGDFT